MPKTYHRLELHLGRDVREGLRRLCSALEEKGMDRPRTTKVVEEILRQFLHDEGFLASRD